MGPQINVIEDKRKFDIMEFVSCGSGHGKVDRESKVDRGREGSLFPARLVLQVLRLVEAQATHFQQGHEELSRLAQYRKELGAQVGPSGAGQVVEGGWSTHRCLRHPLCAQLHQLVLNSARERRDMEQRHVLLKQKVRAWKVQSPAGFVHGPLRLSLTSASPQELGGEEPEPTLKQGPGGLVMEGHLFKRASNAFKTWSR